jgi:hypothetical protein
MEIFNRELGVQPTVFRAPCGASCKAMYAALRQVGIHYQTSVFISATGYEHLPHNSGQLQPKWVADIPHHPFRWYSDVIEAPILNEYTWRGAGQRSAEFIELAKQDLDHAAQASPIVVLLMHTHGIADDYEHTFRLVDAVIEHVSHQPEAKFSTFGALVASGALAAAATTTGPDLLPM